MKLRVTKGLTCPGAGGLCDRRRPEFPFAGVVRSLSAGQLALGAVLKTPGSQRAQGLLSQGNRDQVLSLLHRRQPVRGRGAERVCHRVSRHRVSRHRDGQACGDGQADRVRAQDQRVTGIHRVDGRRDQVTLWGSAVGLEFLGRVVAWSLRRLRRTWLSLRFPGPSSMVSGRALPLVRGSDALFTLQFLNSGW